ncbi:unnamed protein product [Rotaria sordida]|uniref:MATH domain-containing protein n=1 Tax=Rotaria sordida TaxID=392033 RepID=A0A815ATQ2_9BILA|nr:unnamed protein product [Rotaria sordida]
MKERKQPGEFNSHDSSTDIFDDYDESPELDRIQSQMRYPGLCVDCQQILSNMLKAEEFHMLCTLCGWNSHFGNYEVTAESSNRTRFLLRFSARRYPDGSKNTNAFCQTINEKMKHVDDNLIVQNNTLQYLSQECSLLKINCEQTNACIKRIKSNHDKFEKLLQETKQLVEDMHYISYNGELLWRIEGFTQKFAEAQSGKQMSIVSPILYSSRNGYKMRVCLFLNGDGDAQGTHMSIYIVLLKGEYDAILPWPFNIPMIFCLFDQTGHNHNIIDKFCPDTTSNSFQRPISEKNIASGIQKYCPLAIIKKRMNSYVQNDEMFIKIIVDFHDTPRQLLPEILKLNPGFPEYVQEDKKHTERNLYKQVREALEAVKRRSDQEVLQYGLVPTYSPGLSSTRQQQQTSTTNFHGTPCEDTSDE